MRSKNRLLIILGILILLSVGLNIRLLINNDETSVLFCGENKTLPCVVFKNPSKAYPAFAYEYTAKLNEGTSIIDSINHAQDINLNGSADITSKTFALREKLNQENIRIESFLKAIFYAYNESPCSEDVKRRYFSFLDTLNSKINELELLKKSVLIKSNNKVENAAMTAFLKDTGTIKKCLDDFNLAYFPPDK